MWRCDVDGEYCAALLALSTALVPVCAVDACGVSMLESRSDVGEIESRSSDSGVGCDWSGGLTSL